MVCGGCPDLDGLEMVAASKCIPEQRKPRNERYEQGQNTHTVFNVVNCSLLPKRYTGLKERSSTNTAN